jgi:two-component system, NarL family, invasion response regulator UvrY
MIRLFIADDRPVFREGLKRIMADVQDLRLVTSETCSDRFLDAALAARADVVLLGDVAVPTPKLLDLIRDHHRSGSKVKVLVLSTHDGDDYAVRALRAGADGYLIKDHSPAQLVEAIRRVASGRRYLSPRLAQRLVFDIQVRSGARPHQTLSDREYQVLSMFCSGKPFSTIALELGLSPKTVGTYRSRILEKLHLKSNAALIRYGIENRMVS